MANHDSISIPTRISNAAYRAGIDGANLIEWYLELIRPVTKGAKMRKPTSPTPPVPNDDKALRVHLQQVPRRVVLCPQCHTEIKAGQAHCTNCGKYLGAN